MDNTDSKTPDVIDHHMALYVQREQVDAVCDMTSMMSGPGQTIFERHGTDVFAFAKTMMLLVNAKAPSLDAEFYGMILCQRYRYIPLVRMSPREEDPHASRRRTANARALLGVVGSFADSPLEEVATAVAILQEMAS